MANQIEVLKQTELLGQQFEVYGTLEEPLFKAKDVTNMLGLTNPREVMSRVDDDERCKLNLPRQGATWMLTENGLYEVLMQSRKPIAREFKKGVKAILKEIRKTGGYMAARADETPEEIMARAMELAKAALERQRKTARLYKDDRELVDAFCALSLPSYCWARPISLEELAAMLRKRGYDTGKKRLASWLRKKGYLRRQYGKYDRPTELALRHHYFETDKVATINNIGEVFIEDKVMISLAGQMDLIEEFIEDHGGGESDLNSWFFAYKEEGGAE